MTQPVMPALVELEDWNLDACLKCSLCVEHCPVSEVSPSFPGPKRLGPDSERWRLELGTFGDPQLSACTGCKQCEMACPAGVRITHMISRAKAKARKDSGGKFGDRYIADTDLLGRLGTLVPDVANLALGIRPVRKMMEKVLGVEADRPLPRFARHPYKVHRRHRPPAGGAKASLPRSATPGRRPVALFTGCYARYYDPDLADAVIEVLEHNDFSVIIPDQVCCGLPFIANGYLDKASHNARYNLERLGPYADEGIPVVVPSSSCALTLKSDYPDLVGKGASAGFTPQVRELGDFLRALWEKGELKLDFGRVEETIAYHEPCHLKAMGNGRPFVEVLRLIPGLEVVELDAGCCGLAGTYGVKQRHYDVSMKIGDRLFTKVLELGTRVTTECETCTMQIEHGTEAETLHPVKILRDAYRAGQRQIDGSPTAGSQRTGSNGQRVKAKA